MLRIGQLKLNPNHDEKTMRDAVAKALRISEKDILKIQIQKRSIDARKKPNIKYVYTVDVSVVNELKVLKKQKGNQVSVAAKKEYRFPDAGEDKLQTRPIVIGSGPAGLF